MTMRYSYQFKDFSSTIECSPIQLKIGEDFSPVFHYSITDFNNNLNDLTSCPIKYFGVLPMIFNYYNSASLTTNR